MSSHPTTGRGPFVVAQAGLSLLAAAVFLARGVRTAAADGLPAGQEATPGVLLAAAATALALAGAGLAVRSARLAGVPLAVALVLELVVLGDHVAPPRLLAALPLIGALAVAVVPGSRPPSTAPPGAPSRARQLTTALAFVLMAPIGFFYLSTGLVAPYPDLFGAYALFAGFAAAAVWLARRRSWWVAAVPPAAAGSWFLMLWLGETFWGWSA